MSPDPRPPLFVYFRPMVEVDGEATALDAAEEIQSRLETVPGVAQIAVGAGPRPYWKFEGTWEVTFHLHLLAGAILADVFAAVMAFEPTGWMGDFADDTPDGARWAVWNRPEDGTAPAVLLRPDVFWAELGTWDGVVYTGPFESADD